jgi:fructose-1,6-bisphosphatase/inositol monophosphatase family enzyme
MNNFDLQVALDTAKEAVKAASAASLSYFRKRNTITLKADHSLATLADRDAEDAILATIRRRFPEHAILTEETGAYPSVLVGSLTPSTGLVVFCGAGTSGGRW